MPHDLETVGQTVVEKSGFGRHDMIMAERYEAPSAVNDNGDVVKAVDPYCKNDMELAKLMSQWLQKHYEGHFWATKADIRQGIVGFNIPALMGMDNWYVINLRKLKKDFIEELAEGAGQVLERYNLPRGRLHLPSFLEARAKHSALLLPFRQVPR